MEQIRDICSGCSKLTLIQNKRHWLCPDCVFEKTHGGKTKQEVYKERHDKKEIKKTHIEKPNDDHKPELVKKLKKIFHIDKVSNKRGERIKLRNIAYKNIDNSREPICEGCGRGDVPLSHSHLLSEQHRPDLYGDEDNIRLHCFDGYNSCHLKWERGLIDEVILMLDFKENLEYIREVDIKIYNKIIAKIEFEKSKKI